MVTSRALLVFNFGIAVILVLVGFLTVQAMSAMQASSRLTDMPTFDQAARDSVEKEPDIEKLRARSMFYFELARELKRARNNDSERMFYDARTLCFVVAALFGLGGLMVIALSKDSRKSKS
jgi:hypothetical protein